MRLEKEIRQPYTIYELEEDFSPEKINRFSMSLYVLQTDCFDNSEAMGNRMSFVLVEQGAGIAVFDKKQIPYLAPCIFCINEQEHFTIKNDQRSSLRVLLFHPEIVNASLSFENIRLPLEDKTATIRQDRALLCAFINDRTKYQRSLSLGIGSYKRIAEMMDGIQQQIVTQNSDNWPCRSRFFVMELLFVLENLYETDGYSAEVQSDNLKEDFTPILTYINLHYKEKITVEEITQQFHISRSTMANMFKENVGDTFLNYINKLRINMAALMLRDTKLTVNEVMYRVGYSDMAHFLRMFKRYTKMTPSVYRESNTMHN